MSCRNCNTRNLPRDSWCTACETVQYCGEQCQREHWENEHRAVCQKNSTIGGDYHYWMRDAVKHPGTFSRHARSEDMSTGEYRRYGGNEEDESDSDEGYHEGDYQERRRPAFSVSLF